jgi:hypothetical protein
MGRPTLVVNIFARAGPASVGRCSARASFSSLRVSDRLFLRGAE